MSTRVAFLDCKCGVAGDMLLGALIDAGASREKLVDGLRSIHALAEEWELETEKVVRSKGRIAATLARVKSIYGHEEIPVDTQRGQSAASDDNETGGSGCHAHHSHEDHSHAHHEHHHRPHRNLEIIREMIMNADGLPISVRQQSVAVFTALAEAEAATHGVAVDKIHFHEVGAVDSIIDTVGTVYALHLLGVQEVHASALPYGEGFTGETAHGILPVPTPATLRLMLGTPMLPGPPGAAGELVTPTGASLVKVLAAGRMGQPPVFVPDLLGVGAGSKDFPGHANVVRVLVGDRPLSSEEGGTECLGVVRASRPVWEGGNGGEDGVLAHAQRLRPSFHPPAGYLSEKGEPVRPMTVPSPLHPPTEQLPIPAPPASAWSSGGWEERHLCELEANLDDMTPETASFALERLLAQPGCADVWYTPAVMKKGRPGLTLHLLCEPPAAPALLRCIFLETPTLGVRAHTVARLALERDFVLVPTRYGQVRAKVGRMGGVVVNVKPEYEDCRGAAMALGLPLRAVVDEATRVARGQVEGGGEGGEGGGEGGGEMGDGRGDEAGKEDDGATVV
ncbi:hypothetical protein NSK_001188 [Nannochloropsis salina CCMP1776]|uniref:Nickel insertion protein n=1 Tax=Nannochloropsis salina CCMP1776 TaxID=1027361 RepID=A0A4D9D804_9STRA|nr:hypothetical protein NSK_001188 [Nannochloropsis salina CCMP1776]|eukprot:TFJ87841.1 hypothetical protein NSK_001188 [Nannochloropsis salina CCMP1776]